MPPREVRFPVGSASPTDGWLLRARSRLPKHEGRTEVAEDRIHEDSEALLDDLERTWVSSRMGVRVAVGIRDLGFHQEVQDFARTGIAGDRPIQGPGFEARG